MRTALATALFAALLPGCNGCSDAVTVSIGGTVSGLQSGTLVLQDNGANDLSLAGNGPFTFAKRVDKGGRYAVTIKTQPPGQTCSVSGGSGIAAANVSSVAVACSANAFTVGGSVSGLSGTLVLRDNGGDDLTLTANGPFAFATPVNSGSPYSVSIASAPPGQSCTVSGGSGVVQGGNVTTVAVACATVYSVGGTVSGLSGTLVLRDSASGATVTLTSNGAFTFYPAVAAGRAYAIDAATQPAGEQCTVANGSGTVGAANVTNLSVTCAASVGATWTWMKGANTTADPGTYGTKGTAAPDNTPSGRYGAFVAKDASGNIWLFGGQSSPGLQSDLWKFDGTNWTWVAGASGTGTHGAYGTLGVAAAANTPGARFEGGAWFDASGNFWIFGGYGYDSAGTVGQMNDLWKFDGANWTWMGGATVAAAPTCAYGTCSPAGVYGTQGTPDAANAPGGRNEFALSRDASGNVWVLGGFGVDSTGNKNYLNDLWKFDGAKWTWMSGAATAPQGPTYGTQGVAASANVPGARTRVVSWIDAAANVWIFGGYGVVDNQGTLGNLNDVWKYDGTKWTWMYGANTANSAGTYGTRGVPGAANIPSARYGATVAQDASGNLWLLGGATLIGQSFSYFNDLWRFDGAKWTWISGSNGAVTSGTYGTKGVADPANVPGGRYDAASWMDAAGSYWLFGGYGWSGGNIGPMNDLWKG